MIKFIKQIITFVLVASLVIAMVGCAQETKEQEVATAAEPTTKSDETATVEGAADEEISLEVWNIWPTDADANAKAFGFALEAYKADHPNVEIVLDSTENEAYKTKLKTAMAANEGPDVMFSWGAGFAQPFVDAGQLLALDDYLSDDVKSRILPGTTSNFTYDGKLYGLPFVSWLGVLYCNQEMFDQYDAKVPDTYDELLAAIEVFNSNKVVPFTVGAKDGWTAMFFQNVLALRTGGVDHSMAALAKAESYTQPELTQGAQILTDLVNANAFDDAALGLTYDEAKISFLNGESPMMYMGSWFAGEVQDESLSLVKDKVTVKNFPSIPGAIGDKDEFLGGAIDTFVVNASTEHKEAAVEFVAYITEHMTRDSFLLGAGLPTWKVDVAGETVDPLVQDILDLANNASGFIVAWDTILSGAAAENHKSLVQEIFAGSKTAEEFSDAMQKFSEAE